VPRRPLVWLGGIAIGLVGVAGSYVIDPPHAKRAVFPSESVVADVHLDQAALTVARTFAEAYFVSFNCSAAEALTTAQLAPSTILTCQTNKAFAAKRFDRDRRIGEIRLVRSCNPYNALLRRFGAQGVYRRHDCVRLHLTSIDCGSTASGIPTLAHESDVEDLYLHRESGHWKIAAQGFESLGGGGTTIPCYPNG
jgi:hypothetical protein